MGYISGVHFQKCSKFGIFFTLNISTIFHLQGRVGAGASPLNIYMPLFVNIRPSISIQKLTLIF